jgi:hypothetical protein
MATAIMSWIGNMGVIPLATFLISPTAGGSIRAIQTIVLPLVQINQILISMFVPQVARRMRTADDDTARYLAFRLIAVLTSIGFVYASAVALAGEGLFEALFRFEGGQITALAITIAVYGFALEGIRYGCNILLYSMGRTSVVGQGQFVSMLSAIAIIPIMGHHLGLTGLILGMAIANNINTLYVTSRFFAPRSL